MGRLEDDARDEELRKRVAAYLEGPPARPPMPVDDPPPPAAGPTWDQLMEPLNPAARLGAKLGAGRASAQELLGSAAATYTPAKPAGTPGTATGPDQPPDAMAPAKRTGVEGPLYIQDPSAAAGAGAVAGNNSWDVSGHPGDISEDMRGAAASSLGTATAAYTSAAASRREAAKVRRAAVGQRVAQISGQVDQVSALAKGELGRLPAARSAVDAIRARVDSALDSGMSYEDAWKEMGSARRVAGALGMAMGAFTEGWTQGRVKNAAAAMIDKAIAQDVADKRQQLKYHLDKLSLKQGDYERVAQKIDAHVNNLAGMYKNVFDLKLLEAAATKGDAAAMENTGQLILKSIGQASKVVDKFSPDIKVSGKKVPGAEAALKGVARVGAGSLAPRPTLGQPARAEGPASADLKSNPYGASAAPGSDILSNPYASDRPIAGAGKRYSGKRPSAIGLAASKSAPLYVDVNKYPKDPDAFFRKYGYVPATYAKDTMSGKTVVVRPGRIMVGNLEYPIGKPGGVLQDLPKDVTDKVAAGGASFETVLQLVNHGATKWSKTDPGEETNLLAYLRKQLPGAERYYSEVGEGLGVLMAVAVQGARPAAEEQRIFGNWQIKSIDGYYTAKKKVLDHIERQAASIEAQLGTHPPITYKPDAYRLWHRQFESFKQRALQAFTRFENSSRFTKVKAAWANNPAPRGNGPLNPYPRRTGR